MIKNIIWLLLFPLLSYSQLTNDWINYDQNYFKFPISEDGIYRIEFQQLVNAGLNIGTIDPRNLQIFAKGKEIPIYIQGESDASFDSNDFIEFYGEKNTGWYDHVLFSDSAHVLNPYISMYTDTLYHFLTWNSSSNNLRMKDEFDLNFSGYKPLKFFWSEIIYTSKASFNSGVKTPAGQSVPEYSEGEGRFIHFIKNKYQKQYDLKTPNSYGNGPDGWIKAEMMGLGIDNHFMNLLVNDSIINESSFFNYSNIFLKENIAANSLNDITKVVLRSVTQQSSATNRVGVAYVHMRYPKAFNLDGKSDEVMYIPSGDDPKDLLVIENYDNLNSTARLYDVTNGYRIQIQPLSGKYYALLPNDQGNERKCYLTTELSVKSITNIVPVSTGDSKFINYQDIITNKGGIDYLLITGSDLLDVANEYIEYRESKGLKSLVFDVEQLYDQFSFGIRKHPMSIRSFCDVIINYWGFNPDYLFLCGKSMTANYTSVRFGNQFDENIVPTWSVLGSDVGFTSGLKPKSILDPCLSTGRISVSNEDQFRNYLRKVKEYESTPAEEWMKQVLHFGGGKDESEQSNYKQYLKDFESLIEDSLFGGKVHTFLKNSSDPLQINLSDSVESMINSGVSLMTFFGHAYAQNFDQSIDDPENYENTGKYPFILANSCLVGNIHTNGTNSGSEQFVLAENKGSIGFLGSSSLGVPYYLYRYSREFYKNLSQDYYGSSIGKIVQKTILNMQDSSSVLNRDVVMHMTLHCDPAVILNSHQKPDYSVYGNADLSQPNVFFTPSDISSELDSFELNVIIKNIGKASGDTIEMLITRDFPKQEFSDTTYSFKVFRVFYSDTINIRLPVDKINGVGLNNFSIRLDPYKKIEELNEINNDVEIALFINSSDIIPVYPYQFAIVPNPDPILKASTGNPYSSLKKYYFQIDTSDSFNSPIMLEEIIESKGGVLEWNPSVSNSLNTFYSRFSSATNLSNPQVFFWRVSSDSIGNGGFSWKKSSFQHVSDKTGWGQSHFHQFKKNKFTFLDYSYDNRKTEFIKQSKTLTAKTHKDFRLRNQIKYEIDGELKSYSSSYVGKSAFLFVAVIDKKTLNPWHAREHGDYGHYNFGDNGFRPDANANLFYFRNYNTEGIDSLVSFINDVPDSNYVLFFSFNGNSCQKWLTDPNRIPSYEDMYNDIGASVDSLKNYPVDYPYILFFKKGDKSSVIESFSPDGLDYITISGKMENYWYNGTIESNIIGPSKKWESFHWELEPSELGSTSDTSNISIYAIDTNGGEYLLKNNFSGEGDFYNLDDSIDASVYPYLKLESFFADDLNRTPDKLIRWQVTYDEMPEAALNPLKLYGYEPIDSVQQGEDLQLIAAIENISNSPMDSIQVSYRVIDHEYNIHPFTYTIESALEPGDVIYDTITVPTSTLILKNTLWYEINPFSGPLPWQLEQYHFNNLYTHSFRVHKDEINPLLDITFDGIHILNGDIVSPSASIVITLDDENEYLILDEKSLVQLYINYPNSSNQDSLILIDPSEYVFTAAELPKNKCKIEYKSNFTKDGIYEIRIRAKDKSSNISGDGDGVYDHKISFKVVTESSITQVINYPNPFSTATKFVFTLTGSEIPDNMLIQIMTITGKVVKEITQEELGSIHIGRNITDYEWDGTDKYGDKLANGVYLYKVKVQKNNSDMLERQVTISNSEGTNSLSDKFFKKGIGKMYILR